MFFIIRKEKEKLKAPVISSESGKIFAAKKDLQIFIDNLVDNAVKFTIGGSIAPRVKI